MNAVGINRASALIRMFGIGFRSKDSVFDNIKSQIQIRTRIGAGSQIQAVTNTASAVQIAAKRNIGGAPESFIISS